MLLDGIRCWFRRRQDPKLVLWNRGYCPTCNKAVEFEARDAWLRDHYVCMSCGSIPRERAIMVAIEQYAPAWRSQVVHESSPCGRGASIRLANECSQYIGSQYFADAAPGSVVNGVRCENLEALSFANESIDLHITQDVMEHLFDPGQAFREIARTLRPGGAHIFTVPIMNKGQPSQRRATLECEGAVIHHADPVYHGNPVSADGALVTMDWGYDITQHIFDACGLFTHVVRLDDLSMGIRAEYIDVFVTVKSSAA